MQTVRNKLHQYHKAKNQYLKRFVIKLLQYTAAEQTMVTMKLTQYIGFKDIQQNMPARNWQNLTANKVDVYFIPLQVSTKYVP